MKRHTTSGMTVMKRGKGIEITLSESAAKRLARHLRNGGSLRDFLKGKAERVVAS